MNLEKVLVDLATLGAPATLGEIKFFAVGRTVQVRSKTTGGQWCDMAHDHDTPEARWTAERRAEQTAAALNEMYTCLAEHIATKGESR